MNANNIKIQRLLAVPEDVIKEFQRRQELQSDQSVNNLLASERMLAENNDEDDLSPEERKIRIANLLERLSAAQKQFAALYKDEGVVSSASGGNVPQVMEAKDESFDVPKFEPKFDAKNESFDAPTFEPKFDSDLFKRVADNLMNEKKVLERAGPPPKKRQKLKDETTFPQPQPTPINFQFQPKSSEPPPADEPPVNNPLLSSHSPNRMAIGNFKSWIPRPVRERKLPDRYGNPVYTEKRKYEKKQPSTSTKQKRHT